MVSIYTKPERHMFHFCDADSAQGARARPGSAFETASEN
jgi:hypothetical protein